MSDVKETFETLVDSSGEGVAISKTMEGDASTGKIGGPVWAFRDSSGNETQPSLTAAGEVPTHASQSGTWTTGRTWTLASGTDSVASVQSGTWTVQQGTPPWSVVGNVASGTTDSGNPVKVGGVFNTSFPTLTNGQRGDIQLDASARQVIAPLTNLSIVKAQLQDNAGNGITSTTIGAKQPLDVDIIPQNRQSYSASTSGSAITTTTPQDVFTITGSATKTVKLLKIGFSMTQTTAATVSVSLIKRAANTAGTSTTINAVPYDSNNAAATATVRQYTANPTPGTAVGFFWARRMFIGTATSVIQEWCEWDFSESPEQRPVLRGTNETLAINLGGTTVAGANPSFYVMWSEE